ncbi:MAG: hypothetical protein H6558_08600 [Lewinellaceae bacterium]|nr:hypothetical protein [Lewinellaceae bacterium]MCB9287396.1 hypothetical protein [Lewinellaceae bacterium]
MKAKQGLIILAAILGILLIVAGIWGFSQNSKRKSLEAQNTELTGTVEDLEELRTDLLMEVDSLQEEYSLLAEQNEELQGSLAKAQETIASKEVALRNAKAKSASEINNLRAEIQQLMDLKAELESSITAVQAENDSLRMAMGILEADLGAARDENQTLANLNKSIQEEVDRLTLANFKATAFQVDLEQKNEKVTTKARRVRTIRTSFDLTNVPSEYQGLRTLYLVITDDKGNPVPATNPITAKTVVNNQQMDIIAVKAKDVDITENQRLSMVYDLEDKLNAGYYRVAIYTDIGLLGASSLRLR